MESTNSCQFSTKYQLSSHFSWHILYNQLNIAVTRWVRSANLPIWKAQREEIIDEIVQETMLKVLKRIHRGESGELSPVHSVEGLSVRVAYNVFIDMVRRDRRFVPLVSDNWNDTPYDVPDDREDFSEVAINNVYNASLFTQVALVIQAFPPKLRTAMLIDLARRMEFDVQPTPLQAAFLKVGILLQDYENLVPQDPIMRSRHSSLVSLGYRKLEMWFRSCESNEVVASTSGA
jgi:DNA-directed RNA polymerase specialized sigma24 family protein